MLVQDVMSRNVITAKLDDKVNEVRHIMDQQNFRRVPVVEKGRVIGIVTSTDMERVSPSEATTLSKYEMIYLWSKITIKDALPPHQKLITIRPDQYIEEAAQLMNDHHIGALPVMDGEQLVGIITETNIFNSLIKLTQVKKSHTRIDINVADKVGTLADITNMIAQAGKNMVNSNIYEESENVFRLVLRIEGHDTDDIVARISEKYDVIASKKMF